MSRHRPKTRRPSLLHAPTRRAPMNILILSRGRTLYSTRRLAEAGRSRGHDVRILDPMDCALVVQNDAPAIFSAYGPLPRIDCVIPRISPLTADMIIGLLTQLEHTGTFCLNPAHPVLLARDKFRSIQTLALAGIPVPKTMLARHPIHLDRCVDLLGGLPVIIKLREGTQGVGVMKVDSHSSLSSTLQALWSLDQSVLLQEFIAESQGSDIRVFVVDQKVVAVMERSSDGSDFRSNLHLGGVARRIPITDEIRQIALRTTEVMGLHVAGVDLLISHRGPLVTEVNSSPGLEGIEGVTGIDIAKSIIRACETYVDAASSASD